MRRLRPVGLLASALLVSVLAGGVGAGPEQQSLTLVAEFADAGALIPGNDVVVDGVKAGSIKRLQLVGGKARVTFGVAAVFTPVHNDATVAIRSVSLLGERFLELDRGTPSAPAVESGAVIPSSRADRAVELQEVLDAVDDPTGTALAALAVALGEGMAGRGQDAAAAMEALEPALTRTTELLEVLGGQNQLLTALVDRVQPVASALGAERGQRMDKLVAATDELLGATAAERPELEGALRRLPAALATARSALAELATLAGQTTPVLASLRPLTGDLRQVANELGAFADATGPALASLDPVLDKGRELVEASRPVVAELSAVAGDMRTVARSQRTLTEALPENLSNLLDFVRNVALATAGRDGINHYLRIFSIAGPQAIGLPASRPAAASGPAPLAFDPGAVTAPATPPVPASPGLLPKLGPPAPGTDPGSATGLTAQQERSLLTYLMGAR
jgi:phospholipid/cholesterol/gamma-HCH transport system substrate-binding protein